MVEPLAALRVKVHILGFLIFGIVLVKYCPCLILVSKNTKIGKMVDNGNDDDHLSLLTSLQ